MLFLHLINSPVNYPTIIKGSPTLTLTPGATFAPTAVTTTTEGVKTTTIGNYS